MYSYWMLKRVVNIRTTVLSSANWKEPSLLITFTVLAVIQQFRNQLFFAAEQNALPLPLSPHSCLRAAMATWLPPSLVTVLTHGATTAARFGDDLRSQPLHHWRHSGSGGDCLFVCSGKIMERDTIWSVRDLILDQVTNGRKTRNGFKEKNNR
jgi:hypothetical protein